MARGKQAPAAPPAPAPTPVALPPANPNEVRLVVVAPGTRTLHDARGRRITVSAGQPFTVDARTAAILLADDSFAAAPQDLVPPPAPRATGAFTVADLGEGGRIGGAAIQAPKPPVDAAQAASSDGGDTTTPDPDAVNPPDPTTADSATEPEPEATPAADSGGVEVLGKD